MCGLSALYFNVHVHAHMFHVHVTCTLYVIKKRSTCKFNQSSWKLIVRVLLPCLNSVIAKFYLLATSCLFRNRYLSPVVVFVFFINMRTPVNSVIHVHKNKVVQYVVW